MFKNAQKIMEAVSKLPIGEVSPSSHYWCLTCRMLFSMDKPVCPYMPKVCINTPIPTEIIPPESVSSLEKLGLFYPKIPQMMMAHLAEQTNGNDIGAKWVNAYLTFLKDWQFEYQKEPFQTIKSYVILVSGCETAQRVQKQRITLILTDVEKVWKKEILYKILESSLELLRKELGIAQDFKLDDLEIIGEMETGKYYCPMCRKFFEFSIQKDTITCPLMAQKCMATPGNISNMNYSLESLSNVYSLTPDIFRRFIKQLPQKKDARVYLAQMLENEWRFQIEEESLNNICESLGLLFEER